MQRHSFLKCYMIQSLTKTFSKEIMKNLMDCEQVSCKGRKESIEDDGLEMVLVRMEEETKMVMALYM